jgi:hypothetical protein
VYVDPSFSLVYAKMSMAHFALAGYLAKFNKLLSTTSSAIMNLLHGYPADQPFIPSRPSPKAGSSACLRVRNEPKETSVVVQIGTEGGRRHNIP